MLRRKLFSHIFLLFACCILQAKDISFTHFTRASDGLSYDGIKAIMEDRNGGIWIGTHMGLSLFDGKRFTSWNKNDFGVESDFVSSIAEDSEGNIWVGTDSGVSILERSDHSFRTLAKNIVCTRTYAIARDSRGTMWIGSRSKGLRKCENGKTALAEGTSDIDNVYRIAIDNLDRVFFAAYCDDIYCYDGHSAKPICNGFFKGDDVEGIVFDGFTDDQALYVASKRNGLCRVDPASGQVVILYKIGEGQRPVAISAGSSLVWLSTTGGLVSYDLKTNTASLITSEKKNPFSLSEDYVTAACQERSGALWVGTFSGGLNYSAPSQERFVKYWKLSDGTSLEKCTVKDFAEDDEGVIWIATERMGLLRLEAGGTLTKAEFKGLPRNITAVCSDRGRLLVGSHQGVYDVRLSDGRVIWHPRFGENSDRIDNRVVSLFRSSEGQIYVGTPVGVMLYNRVTDVFEPVDALKGITVEDFAEDAQGNLWLASYSQGAFLYSPSSRTLERSFCVQNGTPPVHEMTSSVTVDTGGTVWVIGFTSGFYRYDKKEENFQSRSTADTPGLPTDLYLSAIADTKGRLWLSSDAGLVVYDMNYGGVDCYLAKDGILPSEFKKSALRCSDGTFLFGAADGFIRFNPSDFDTPAPPAADGPAFMKTAAGISLLVILGVVFLAIIVAYILYRKAMAKEHRRQADRDKAKETELYNEKLSFFSNVIHEIKTPLTLIRTPLQNLLNSGQASKDQMADLQIISNSTDYLDQLVKELLEFVSVQEHGYVPDLRNTDIAERLGFVCYNFSETAKNSNIRLSYKAEPESIITAVDTKALSKIYNNLVHNAVKYSESRIDIHAGIENGKVVVRFVNDGPQIPKNRREAIFQPFVRYTNQKSKYQQSFGIGLAQARTLTELQGGTLILSDRDDATEFILTLPLRNARQAPEPDTDEALAPTGGNLPLLLIVEDNADLSSYLKRKLRNNYGVIAVPSAEKALEVLHSKKIDVLLTDIGLQTMSGVELCRKVSRDKELSHIPIIIISAISSTETKIKCMENGATVYIEKPFSQDYLEACIKGVLAKREAQKKAYRESPDTPIVNLQDRDEEFLRKLDRMISENIGDSSFSNKQIEEGLFISRSSLNRKVRTLLGTTPNGYVHRRRLEEAARMLSEGKSRINEVAYAVGFNSPSYFAKCFKKEFGMLPAEYMKANDNKN